MNRFQEMYQQKLTTAEGVAEHVKSGFICACPTALGEPSSIIAAVGERAKKGEIENVYHHAILSVKPGSAFLDPDLKGKYDYVSWFTDRKSVV